MIKALALALRIAGAATATRRWAPSINRAIRWSEMEVKTGAGIMVTFAAQGPCYDRLFLPQLGVGLKLTVRAMEDFKNVHFAARLSAPSARRMQTFHQHN